MTALDELLTNRHIVVCTGPGGVGKTTTSAALALRAAETGRRVVVCTIDPARRLAQSLGLDELGNTPRRVALPSKGRGELHAMMLDMKRTFDDMVLDLAPPARAQAIFANPFYQHVSSTLSGTQEYMAMEKLWELHEEGGWELIVIDTPPTRSALDFLEAPQRLTDFLEGRFLKLLLWPYLAAGRSGLRMLNVGARAVLRTVTRITGSELFSDVAVFFQQFEGMYGSFKARATRVHELLAAKRTAFVVVTAPTDASLREARYFAARLDRERMQVGAVVVNRVHEVPLAGGLQDPRALAVDAGPGPLRAALEVYADWQTVARREDRLVAEALGDLPGVPVWPVPDLAEDVHDLPALRRISDLIAGAR